MATDLRTELIGAALCDVYQITEVSIAPLQPKTVPQRPIRT